jgi:hypothetical protein
MNDVHTILVVIKKYPMLLELVHNVPNTLFELSSPFFASDPIYGARCKPEWFI